MTLLTACAGGGSAGPAGLAYGIPTVSDASYAVADTVRADINAMGQTMTMSQASETIFDASFEANGDGVTVSLLTRAFNGMMSQPMGAPVHADESGIEGPLVFSLSREGNVTPVSRPELSGGAEQTFPALTTTYTFFPGLPGGAVDPGMTWTDTVQFEGSEGGGDMAMLSVLEYTAVGDTVVDGRTLLKLDVVGTAELEIVVVAGGMEALQSIFAGVAGHILWDMRSGIMYERVTVMDGDGTVSVPVVPQPLPLTLSATSVARLEGP
jgi:hypothetical protein